MEFFRESELDKLIKERNSNGWVMAGYEKLTVTRFQPDARFLDVPLQSEDDIKKKYKNDDTEVELVLAPNHKLEEIRKILSPEEFAKASVPDSEKSYYVFVKKKN